MKTHDIEPKSYPMKKMIIAFFPAVLQVLSLPAQDLPATALPGWASFLHIESGLINPSGTVRDNIAIRQNISSFYVSQLPDGEVNSATTGDMAGVRWEYFLRKFKTGVSAGLRYTAYFSEITGYSAANADFFYLRYSMQGSDTKFARVKSMNETSHFITLPLEVRVIPIQRWGMGFFVKAGAELSLLNVKHDTRINFQDDAMNVYEDEILENITSGANKFYSTLYTSVGVKFGRENRVNYIIEAFLPSFYLSKDNFSLTEVDYFEGFKLSVQFPVRKAN